MAEIRYLLFALDGVLIDASEWHYEAFNLALAPFGFHINRADHLKKFDGLTTWKKLELLTVERGLDPYFHSEIHEQKQIHTLAIVEKRARPNAAIVQTLEDLRRDGKKLSLCSNALPETIELMLRKSGIAQYFEFCLSNRDVKNPKPDPEIFRIAMNRLGAAPAQCLLLENNAYGLQAARASGAHVLRVRKISEISHSWIASALRSLEQQNLAA